MHGNPGVQGNGNNCVKQGYPGSKPKSGGGKHNGTKSSPGTVGASLPHSGNAR